MLWGIASLPQIASCRKSMQIYHVLGWLGIKVCNSKLPSWSKSVRSYSYFCKILAGLYRYPRESDVAPVVCQVSPGAVKYELQAMTLRTFRKWRSVQQAVRQHDGKWILVKWRLKAVEAFGFSWFQLAQWHLTAILGFCTSCEIFSLSQSLPGWDSLSWWPSKCRLDELRFWPVLPS